MHGAVARVACRAVGGPREQGVGRGERAASMCGMAVAAGMAMRGAEAWAACRMERGPRELYVGRGEGVVTMCGLAVVAMVADRVF